MENTWKQDIIAGFNVFLLALPLCLGIALASNFPPTAGLITAMVGGILASCLGGAKLSIKGPAAGLIVIVLGAVLELGAGDLQLGYERTLAVGVIAAILQILIAFARKAVIAEMMPPSVIHGMLAAIGVIIISKQSYVMIGSPAPISGPLMQLAALPSHMMQLNPFAFGFGCLALTISVFWPHLKKFSATLASIPAALVILCIIIPLSFYLQLPEQFRIHLPDHFLSALRFPDFSAIFSITSIKYIVMFTLIGSIESLLTVCAIDSITPHQKSSDLNQDLKAIGIANLVSACIGGLPMISEIVRSKANIHYGAQTAKANFFHGVFMLIAVTQLSAVLNLIPLSALAALLIFVGIKLASPKEFIHVYKLGKDQFFIFCTTFFVILLSDILMGVMAGMLLKLGMHVLRGYSLKTLFKPKIVTESKQDCLHVSIEGPLTFLGYLKFKNIILKAPQEFKNIFINLNSATYLDHTVLTKFQTLAKEFKDRGLNLDIGKTLKFNL